MSVLKFRVYTLSSWVWLWLDYFFLLIYPVRRDTQKKQLHFISARVEYFSQFEEKWEQSGAENKEEANFWSDQICALTCLKMVAQNFPLLPQPFQTIRLAKLSLSHHVYTLNSESKEISGIFWDTFEKFLKGFSIRARFKKYLTVSQIARILDEGHIVLASVSPFIHLRKRSQNKIGHTILIHGYALEKGRIKDFYIKDPGGWQENNTQERSIRIKEFLHFYSGRGFIIYV